MIPGNANSLLLASAAEAAAAGVATKSLRFNSGDSGYLSKNFSSAGNRDTWTWAAWIKIADFNTSDISNFYFGAGTSDEFYICQRSGQQLQVRQVTSGSEVISLITDQVLRDVAGWGHLVVAVDTGQATSSNRIKVYWNGSQITSFSTSTYPSQNLDTHVSNNVAHYIGKRPNGTLYLDAYLADVYFIDGSQLDPTSFGAYDDNGVWQAAAYSGTFGTNGFHLDFSDATSTTTIAEDSSGNNNDFTANNISVTAGSGNDSLFDAPTNGSQSDTGAGGEVSGNYATLNPLRSHSDITLSEGNLKASSSSVWKNVLATIGVTTGKYYFELSNMSGDFYTGIADKTLDDDTGSPSSESIVSINHDGYVAQLGTTHTSYSSSDVVGVAINATSKTVTFYKNGSTNVSASYTTSNEVFPFVALNSTNATFNFGQRAFAYSAPSGFKALCTTNLPTPTIADGSDYFDIDLYSGTGASHTRSGFSFSPDWVWIKVRDAGSSHRVFDTVRGAGKHLLTDDSGVEQTHTAALSAFTSDGYTLGANDDGATNVNQSGKSYVGWLWDAGSSTVSNTDGSITSNVRANASAGFSIVTYTGNATNGATVGHGLNAEIGMIIIKNRDDGGTYWVTYHSALGGTKALALNRTDSVLTNSLPFNNTDPTSSVFTIGAGGSFSYSNNQSGEDHVAYCFAPVEGYSAFGSYEGNGSSDGTFVYTGFKIKFLIIKQSDGTNGWFMWDTERDSLNANTALFSANAANAEQSQANHAIDFLSNGFKTRDSNGAFNGSGNNYIYIAFAENPFQANGGLAR